MARTYSALRRAKAEGSAKVKVVCSGKQCSDCMALDGKTLAVEELLASFKSQNPSFPHPLQHEEVGWCPAPYLSAEIALRDGDDPEFHAWLVKHLE